MHFNLLTKYNNQTMQSYDMSSSKLATAASFKYLHKTKYDLINLLIPL